MSSLDFEGRLITAVPGDTVASALFRNGVRTFSRSFKYHRRRGLYCLSGDCPNCLVNVDGDPGVRACITPAEESSRVSRENAWPSAERDVLAIADRLHWLLPVGFYYKTMLRPRWLWPMLEPLVRKAAGLGEINLEAKPASREVRNLHPNLLVIGGGVAGLAAAVAASEAGLSVVLCDEGRLGEKVPPGATRKRIAELAERARQNAILILENAPAIGVYEGPLVPVNARDFLHVVHPERVVVATGALEQHDAFPNCDLPGVWLGRGAARLAGVHRIPPGRRAVIVGGHHEVAEQAELLRTVGVETIVLGDVAVERALGSKSLRGIVVEGHSRIECDALVLCRGFSPRDGLLRQGAGLPVSGAGQVISPECSLEEAENIGRRVGLGEPPAPIVRSSLRPPSGGYVCLCEDVELRDLERAWSEGFQSTELLKRYTTATMGPCQGALCHAIVGSFVAARAGAEAQVAQPTTARPPTRAVTLEEAAAGERADVHQRTTLHQRHLDLGAAMEPAGSWRRPQRYGDVDAEYWAVRRDVSIMDVGTLGKYLVGGPDALEFLERIYPCRIADLEAGQIRYGLLLGQHGFVLDDGLICALEGNRYYLTFTSGGAEQAEAYLRDWIETWGLKVHIVNRTAALGAINVAGPRARELLGRISSDPLDGDSFAYLRNREIQVAGIPCIAIRVGFVGELAYELHHPSSRSVELWDALLGAGVDLGIRPHGLDALRLLRLEKGHVIIGQDTDFDTTPAKLGMDWMVKLDKPHFVGRTALKRIGAFPIERRLLALRFHGETPPEGAPLSVDGRLVGHLTSSRFSPILGYGIGLGWSTRVDGNFPSTLQASGAMGTVVTGAFYDPKGMRIRA